MKNREFKDIIKNTVANCRIVFDKETIDSYINGKKSDVAIINSFREMIDKEKMLKRILSFEMNTYPLVIYKGKLYAVFDKKPVENLPVLDINVDGLLGTSILTRGAEYQYVSFPDRVRTVEGWLFDGPHGHIQPIPEYIAKKGVIDDMVEFYNERNLETKLYNEMERENLRTKPLP